VKGVGYNVELWPQWAVAVWFGREAPQFWRNLLSLRMEAGSFLEILVPVYWSV
jgi:hypothetical protein